MDEHRVVLVSLWNVGGSLEHYGGILECLGERIRAFPWDLRMFRGEAGTVCGDLECLS